MTGYWDQQREELRAFRGQIIQDCVTLATERTAKIDRLVRRWLDHTDYDPRWVLEHEHAHLWLQQQLRAWW